MKFAMITPTRFDKDPSSFDRYNYDEQTKKMLIDYMESIEPNSACGHVEDCVTGIVLMDMEDVGYEDGEYSWSAQGIYHLKNYNLAVYPEFIEHVKKKIGA